MKALLIVDVQNDFCPGGALATKNGDKIIPVINRLMASGIYDRIIASQDWHPNNHASFACEWGADPFMFHEPAGLTLWPKHCVAGTPGAELRPSLQQQYIHYIVRKGLDSANEEYSAYPRAKDLLPLGTEIHVVGIATDYCVWETVHDASLDHSTVHVITDAVSAVNADSGMHSLSNMKDLGVTLLQSSTLLA